MKKKYIIGLIVSFLLGIQSKDLCAQRMEDQSEQLIKFETSLGDMLIKLYNETPGHRDNMIKLIHEGFYKDQLFHRVIGDFMVQGGYPHSKGAEKGQRLGTGGPGYTIPAEFHDELIHKKGALAAARKGDRMNPDKESSGSQFYLVQGRVFSPEELNLMAQKMKVSPSVGVAEIYTTLGGTPHLDGSYTVFGEVVEGLEVLDRIAALDTDAYDRPLEDVVYSISLVK